MTDTASPPLDVEVPVTLASGTTMKAVLELISEQADHAEQAEHPSTVTGIAIQITSDDGETVLVAAEPGEGVLTYGVLSVTISELRDQLATLTGEVDPVEETVTAVDTGALEDDEEEDWLNAKACQIRPDGSVDEDCEACQ